MGSRVSVCSRASKVEDARFLVWFLGLRGCLGFLGFLILGFLGFKGF